ncbi:hypothetical protein CALVIDRAFT_535774 [Calocera viscosa TUFC12733]|uniref:Uncharacterized protein n=1 Tax=Calocera viscosa (strain TUFC12733) TaxID=1330018 RepID=A0A167NXS3_CALVF|nr:hypothetical protein CALVIDRAFT_535774 [Calocera viscosa TUFC12733]
MSSITQSALLTSVSAWRNGRFRLLYREACGHLNVENVRSNPVGVQKDTFLTTSEPIWSGTRPGADSLGQ